MPEEKKSFLSDEEVVVGKSFLSDEEVSLTQPEKKNTQPNQKPVSVGSKPLPQDGGLSPFISKPKEEKLNVGKSFTNVGRSQMGDQELPEPPRPEDPTKQLLAQQWAKKPMSKEIVEMGKTQSAMGAKPLSEKEYDTQYTEARFTLDKLPSRVKAVINENNRDEILDYLKNNPYELQRMQKWIENPKEAGLQSQEVVLNTLRGAIQSTVQKDADAIGELDRLYGTGAKISRLTALASDIDKTADELKKYQTQVEFYQNKFLENKGNAQLVNQIKAEKAAINKFDYKGFKSELDAIQKELAPTQEYLSGIEAQYPNGIPRDVYAEYQNTYTKYQSAALRYNELLNTPEYQQYQKSVDNYNNLVNQQKQLVSDFQGDSNYKKALQGYEKAREKYDLLRTEYEDIPKFDVEQYFGHAKRLSDAQGVLSSIEPAFPMAVEREKIQEKIKAFGELNPNVALTQRALTAWETIPEAFEKAVGGALNYLSTTGKALAGYNEKDLYTLTDKYADYLNDFGKLNNTLTYEGGITNKSGDINWKSLPVEALRQIGNLAVFATVGKFTGGTGTAGMLGSTASTSAPMVSTAYFMSRMDRAKEAEQAGLQGAQKEMYVSTLSLLEGLSELIMPDAQLLTKPVKNKLIKDAVEGVSKGKNWYTKQVLLTIAENSGKEAAEELVVKLGELLEKTAVNYAEGNVFDTEEYKNINEWVATALVAAPLAGVSTSISQINQPTKQMEADMYKASSDLTASRSVLDAMVEKGKITAQQADKVYKNIVRFAAVRDIILQDISPEKAVQLVPLIEQNETIKMLLQDADDIFKPRLQKALKENIEKAQEILNSKEQIANEPITRDEIRGTDAVEESVGEQPAISETGVEETVTEEVVLPEQGEEVQLEPRINGGQPRIMVYDEGVWKEKVGNTLSEVSSKQQQEAQEKYANEKPSPTQMDVGEQARDGEEMGERNPQEEITQEGEEEVAVEPSAIEKGQVSGEVTTEPDALKDVESTTKEFNTKGVDATILKEGFTDGQDLNKVFRASKAKYGEKQGAKYNEAANRLVNPNTNRIIEVRSNGVVVKENGRYLLKPFTNTDANFKKWELGRPLDVTEQYTKELSEAYHKAKADGSNPKLVAAVEELLGKPQKSQAKPLQTEAESKAKAELSNIKLSSKQGDINTGQIDDAKLKKGVVDKTIAKDENGNPIKVYINFDKLKGVLLSKNGKNIFRAMQGRFFIIARVGEFYLPFYISSAGTSGKNQGEWYPFFGYNNWLVKGTVGKKGEMEYTEKVDEVTNLLNQNLQIPAKYFTQFGQVISGGTPLSPTNVFYDINEDFDYESWFVDFDRNKGNTYTEEEFVADRTGLNPKGVKNDGGGSADAWINDVLALTENAELASKGVIKPQLEPEIKSNLEKIEEETGTNFREIQNVYNKYGEGKPLNEITVEDYRAAEAKRQAEKEPTEKQIADTAQKAGITPQNLRDLYKINRELFGLDRIKSLASAIAMDRMVGAMAKRANINKAEMYGRLKFEKSSEQDLPQGVKFQVDAWHGSPYQFDKFTTEKIGTGEGAQAFGWGLYFTDLEDIAKNYADKLGSEKITFDGVDINDTKGWNKAKESISTLASIVDGYGFIRSIESIRKLANKAKSDYLPYLASDNINEMDKELFQEYVNAANYLLDNIDNFKVEKGKNLYKVSLHKGKTPDQYTWLEWDKPFDQELKHKLKKDALQKVLNTNTTGIYQFKHGAKWYKGTKIGNEWKWVDRYDNSRVEFNEVAQAFEKNFEQEVSGNQSNKNARLYQVLSDFLEGDKNASLFLLESGIDGIKYPAESIARGTTSDTARGFNYVVFDENAVSIEEVIKFQKDAEKARGAMMIGMDGQAVIYALTDPNVSTPLHEMAHVFEHYMTDAERAIVQSWAGTKGWTTQTSEKFARGFEKYLAEGKAPTSGLQKIFDKFKTWLTDIYNGITGSDIDIELNEPMREIYAKMLGAEAVKPAKAKKAPKSAPKVITSETIKEIVPEKTIEAVKALTRAKKAMTETARTKVEETAKDAPNFDKAKYIMDNLENIKAKLLESGKLTTDCKWG